MIKGFGGDITVNVIASIIASAILLAAGFLWGKYKERRRYGRKLEEYDFYPYTINRENVPSLISKIFGSACTTSLRTAITPPRAN